MEVSNPFKNDPNNTLWMFKNSAAGLSHQESLGFPFWLVHFHFIERDDHLFLYLSWGFQTDREEIKTRWRRRMSLVEQTIFFAQKWQNSRGFWYQMFPRFLTTLLSRENKIRISSFLRLFWQSKRRCLKHKD